jgi:5'-nucleotidase
MKKRLYCDMDQVLCDFKKGIQNKFLNPINQIEKEFPQSRLGFFITLEPIPGAIAAVNLLQKHFDVWILSRPSFFNLNCYTEKAIWIRNHLGFEMQKKLILCGDKSICKGDYLIDDMTADGQDKFEGEFILFGSEKFPDWFSVLKHLKVK